MTKIDLEKEDYIRAFTVERTRTIRATPDQIRPLLSNFRNWRLWSPWEEVDTDLHRAYSGPHAGVGAHYAWSGNRKAGAGTMEITDLDEETCSELERFAEGKTGVGEDVRVARAMHVLAHESSHLAGIRDEAAADCYGLQRTAFVAEGLGADPARAERLARIALAERAVTAPADYRSSECHDGGALDLDPASSVWP